MRNGLFLLLLVTLILTSRDLPAQEATEEDVALCYSIALQSDWYQPYLMKNNVPGTEDTCIILINNGYGVSPNSLDSYLSDCAIYFGLSEIVFYYHIPIYNLLRDFEIKNDSLVLDVSNGSWGKVDGFKYGRFKCIFIREKEGWKLLSHEAIED